MNTIGIGKLLDEPLMLEKGQSTYVLAKTNIVMRFLAGAEKNVIA